MYPSMINGNFTCRLMKSDLIEELPSNKRLVITRATYLSTCKASDTVCTDHVLARTALPER